MGHLDEIDALYGYEGHRWTPAGEILAVVRRPEGARLLHDVDPDPDLLDPTIGWDYDTVEEALSAMWEWNGVAAPPGRFSEAGWLG